MRTHPRLFRFKKVTFIKISFPCTLLYFPFLKTKEEPKTEKSFEPNGEIRTKELRKNSKSKKVRFLKIAVSFPSHIPYPKTPTDHREKTERRATELFYKISAIFHTNLAHLKKKV